MTTNYVFALIHLSVLAINAAKNDVSLVRGSEAEGKNEFERVMETHILGLLTTLVGGALLGLAGITLKSYLDVLSAPKSESYRILNTRLNTNAGFIEVYQKILSTFLKELDRFFEGDDPGHKLILEKSAPNPWSAATFDRCLMFSLAYPILTLFIGWVAVGDVGIFGSAIGLSSADSILARGFALLSVGLAFGISCLGIRMPEARSGFVLVFVSPPIVLGGATALFQLLFPETAVNAFFVGCVISIALGFSSAFAFTIASGGVASGIAAFTVAGAVGFAGTIRLGDPDIMSFILIGSGYFAGFLVFGFSGAIVDFFARNASSKFESFIIFVLFSYIVGTFFFIAVTVNTKTDTNEFGLLIGLIILPVLNAPFDWFSIGLTRKLLRQSLITE